MRHAAERSVRIREVEGSNPFGSTKAKTPFSFEDGVLFYIIRHSMIRPLRAIAADFFLPVGRRYANIGLINRHTGEKLW